MKKLISLFTITLCFVFITMNANAQFNVSGGTGLAASYTSLTNGAGSLFADINATAQTGNNIVVDVVGNSVAETGTTSLDAGAWTSITISPSGGAARLISGTVAGILINFNGADNVTIDGLNSGGNSLIISNGSISSASPTGTIRFINGATNNKITRCGIAGSSQVTLGTAGGTIVFSTDASTANGNDNNEISKCDIGPSTATLPVKHIFSLGTITSVGIRNSGNLIDDNNIFDFFGSGATACAAMNILAGNDSWTISRNRIYQTATRTFTTTAIRMSGIVLNGGSTASFPGAFTLTDNIIGYASNSQTGTFTIAGSSNEFRPIDMPSVDATVATSLQGNKITAINQTSSRASTTTTSAAFIAIGGGYSVDGKFDIGNVTGNQIGSTDGSSTIVINAGSTTASTVPCLGIYEFGDGASRVSNNQIGNITINQGAGPAGTTTGFRAILITTVVAGTATEVKENVVTDIRDNLIGGYILYGITVSGKAGYVFHNTVKNFTGNSNLASTVVMNGITVSHTAGTSTVEKNDVHFLTNTVNNTNLVANYAYDFTFPNATSNVVKQNYAYGNSLILPAANTSSQLFGMQFRAGTYSAYNNMVTMGLKSDGSSITTANNIRGMQDSDAGALATKEFYYNTVYVTGSGVAAGGLNTYCMNSTSTGTRIFKDNIFWSDRSNAVGGGTAHFAIAVAGVGPNPLGLTSDYNDLAATGTDGNVGLYNAVIQPNLAAWKIATGQDANSSSVTVNFVMPSVGDLHLTGASIGDLNLTGTPIPGITTDIDKNIRHDNQWERPYMGAHEPQQALPVELASFTSTVSGRDAVLNWSTSSEINNQGFDVERKTDGEWSKVGSVNGNGTTNETHNYSFTDRNLNNGTYNYRLKQIDFNGHFEYFNLSNEVIIGIPEKYNLSQNYPNPFNPSTKINYDLPFDSKVSIKLFDMSGREVATLVNENISAGYHSINFNGANLSSGTYFYKIVADANGNNFTSVKKMVLIK